MFGNFFRSKLQTKILKTMAVVSLLPLAVIGYLAVYSLNYFHNEDLQLLEKNLLKKISTELSGELNNVLESLQLQVSFEQVGDIKLSDQQQLLRQLLLQLPQLEEASFISMSAEQYGLQTSRLLRSQQDFASSDRLLNFSQLPSFSAAAAGKQFVSPVHFTLKGPMVRMAVPVFNTPQDQSEKPQVISVLAAAMRLQPLQKIILQSSLGSTGYVYLSDRSGFVLAHSRQDAKPGGFLPPASYEGLQRTTNASGETVAAQSARFEPLGLTLVAHWPVEEADQLVNTAKKQVFAGMLLVAALVFWLSLYLTLWIVKPIRKLQMAALAVAKGNFDGQVSIATGDELQDLGKTFNTMTKGLKELQKLKDEFVFIASHELRTPVTAMKGYLSMVQSGEAGPVGGELKQLLGRVGEANQRLVQLVDDLLSVARNDAGKLTVQVTPTKLAPLVASVLSEVKPLAQEKNIQLSGPKFEQAAALADEGRYKEILVNLVGNAIKYTPGAGLVSVQLEAKGKAIVTSVTDTGLGMDKAEQAKLFEKFYRVKNTQTKNIQGTGLGLFIVKQLVEKMGGKIWVASEKGKGSVFSFSLPKA